MQEIQNKILNDNICKGGKIDITKYTNTFKLYKMFLNNWWGNMKTKANLKYFIK